MRGKFFGTILNCYFMQLWKVTSNFIFANSFLQKKRRNGENVTVNNEHYRACCLMNNAVKLFKDTM